MTMTMLKYIVYHSYSFQRHECQESDYPRNNKWRIFLKLIQQNGKKKQTGVTGNLTTSIMRLTVWIPIINTTLSSAIEHCVAMIAIWDIWIPNQSKWKQMWERETTLIKIRNDEMEKNSFSLSLLLTIVYITKILITLEIRIYLPSKH